jgi:DNA polymerase I-like protein with 3'-5' exonuclease and polymerase domains
VTQDVKTEEVICHTDPSTLAPLVKEYDQIIGHNLIGFDAPVLRKVWNIGIPKSKAVDTLVLSRLLNPVIEGGHSLRAWGNRLGDQKIEFNFEDFDHGLTPEMQEYCVQDVKLTRTLFLHLQTGFSNWKSPQKSILLEHEIAVICSQQEREGFRMDIDQTETLRATLADRMGDIEDCVQSVFPPIVEERWSEKTGKRLKDRVTVFNLASRKQIAERLMGLGWKPTKHTEKGQPIVDESTLENIDIAQAQLIAEYLMLQKRVGMIDSWLKHVDRDTNRVHGGIITTAGVTRPQAKTLIYATLYGAGPSKIGSIVNGGAREGQNILERFYKGTPALSKLMEKVKKVAVNGYVPGLDGRRIAVRSEHAALNSLLQGCGAIIAKQWCIEAHKTFKAQRIPVQQVAFVHDEIQIETPEEYGEQVAQIMCDAASQAGITLGFRCPVDAESKIGKNWFETH